MLHIFPVPVVESAVSLGSPGSFRWRMALEMKGSVLGMLMAPEVSLLLGLLRGQSLELHQCILTYPSSSVYLLFCVYVKLYMSSYF